MISKGIRIEWLSGEVEYVPLNVEHPEEIREIPFTISIVPGGKKAQQLNTTSTESVNISGLWRISLQYEAKHNPDCQPSTDWCWGTSSIEVRAGASHGTARWKDDNYPEHDGEVRWTRLNEGLVGEKRRITTTAIQRKQKLFRQALLALDGHCALTGEKTVEALEAAHVIPVAHGGREVVENGILLRADLHHLYDAGCFRIDEQGCVTDFEQCGTNYAEVLSSRRLPRAVYKRVGDALRRAAKCSLPRRTIASSGPV